MIDIKENKMKNETLKRRIVLKSLQNSLKEYGMDKTKIDKILFDTSFSIQEYENEKLDLN